MATEKVGAKPVLDISITSRDPGSDRFTTEGLSKRSLYVRMVQRGYDIDSEQMRWLRRQIFRDRLA